MKTEDLITVIENQMKANRDLLGRVEVLEALNHVALSLAFFTATGHADADPDFKQALLEYIDTVDAPPDANKEVMSEAVNKVKAFFATRGPDSTPKPETVLKLITKPAAEPDTVH